MRARWAMLVPVLLCAACASQRTLYFGTATSVGLDVSGTVNAPDHVSIAYRRAEVALIPPKDDGTAYSVLGELDADLSLTAAKVRQLFATGEAAEIAAATGASPPESDSRPEAPAPSGGPGGASEAEPASQTLVFVTGTTFGLDLSAGQGQLAPQLVLGYRRAEAALVPIDDPTQQARSVYADLSLDSSTAGAAPLDGALPASAPQTWPSTLRGVRIKQRFATGKAARLVAADPAVRDKLRAAVGLDTARVDAEAAFKNDIVAGVEKLDATGAENFLGWLEGRYAEVLARSGTPAREPGLGAKSYVRNVLMASPLPRFSAEQRRAITAELRRRGAP